MEQRLDAPDGGLPLLYLRNMYVKNNLVKPDGITMNGVPLDLRRVRNDVYSVAAKEDHIAVALGLKLTSSDHAGMDAL